MADQSYFGPGISTTLTPIPHANRELNGIAAIDTTLAEGSTFALAVNSGSAPLSDVVDKIRYSVSGGPAQTGYLLRDAASGIERITDILLNPVAGAVQVPAVVTQADDVISPVTYKVGAGPEQQGYQMRKPDNSLYIADSAFNQVTGSVLVASQALVAKDYDITLSPGQTTFNLPAAPATGTEPLIQIVYQGFSFSYGEHFSVSGQTIDVSASGLNLDNAKLDIKYWVSA